MSLTVGHRNRTKDYNFDAVFDQESTQDQVLKTASALSKVPLMAIMSVSLHMVRPDQERPSRSKVTKKIRA